MTEVYQDIPAQGMPKTLGVILAGGHATRLHPITLSTSKQLLPVYDKPLIFYPLTTLINAGISRFLIIVRPDTKDAFFGTLKYGKKMGIDIMYGRQAKPGGIPQAFQMARHVVEDGLFERVALILGDNIFDGLMQPAVKTGILAEDHAVVYLKSVSDPQRFGVAKFRNKELHEDFCGVVEKPKNPPSNWAVTGLYIFPSNVCDVVEQLKPSARGELEIADLINIYANNERVLACKMAPQLTWIDTGTIESLNYASQYVRSKQAGCYHGIGNPYEAAMHQGFISYEQFKDVMESGYAP